MISKKWEWESSDTAANCAEMIAKSTWHSRDLKTKSSKDGKKYVFDIERPGDYSVRIEFVPIRDCTLASAEAKCMKPEGVDQTYRVIKSWADSMCGRGFEEV